MKTTKVKVNKLLETLKENRKKHASEYTSAREIWEGEVLKRLTKVRKEAGKGNFENVHSPLRDLPQPEKFLDQYDTAIAKLEWEVHEEVELDDHEFDQYVLDQWSFSNRFIASTALYNSPR